MDEKPLLSSLLFSSKYPKKLTDEEKQNTLHLDTFDFHRNNSTKKAWKITTNKNNLQNLLSEQEQDFCFKQILKRFEKHIRKDKYNKHYFSSLTELLSKRISNKEYLRLRSSLTAKRRIKKINCKDNSNTNLFINFLTNPSNHRENKDFDPTKSNEFLFDYDYETIKANKKTILPLTQRNKLKHRLIYKDSNIFNEENDSLLKDYDPVEDFILTRNKKKYIEHLEDKYKYFDMPSNNKLSRKRFLCYQKITNISERLPIELDNKKPESMILKRIEREKKAKSSNILVFSKTAINFRKKIPKTKSNVDENKDKLLKEIYFKIKNNYCKF